MPEVEIGDVIIPSCSPTHPSPHDVRTHAQSFAVVKPEIDAVPDEALVAINTHVPRAVETAIAAAGRVERLLPALARLPDYPVQRIRKLRLYAGALLYAHLRVMDTIEVDARWPELLAEAIALRDDLLAVARALAQVGLLSFASVVTIGRGRGRAHRSLATDLTALASLYDDAWERLTGSVPIERSMVDRAGVLGAELLEALGGRRLEPLHDEQDDARRTRDRAYALFMEVYDTCRQGVSFLRWKHGDVHRFVPSLHPRRRRRAKRYGIDGAHTPARETAPRPDSPSNPEPTEVEVSRE